MTGDPRQVLGPVLAAAVEALVAERVAQTLAERTAGASEYVTPDEAAAILRCPRQGIYDLASSGRLARFKQGKRTLHRRADVLSLVKPETRK